MLDVARKLNTTEELRRDQNCLFRQYYGNKGKPTKNLFWVQVPMEVVSVAVITVDITVNTNVCGFRNYFLL